MGLPIVLMDMDGPLAAFDEAVWALGHEIHEMESKGDGSPAFDIDHLDEQSARFLTDHCTTAEVASLIRLRIRGDYWFDQLPVVEGAVAGMAELAEWAEVWVVSKPLVESRSCRDQKARWLERNIGRGWSDRLVLASDKSLVFGDVLVDDAIKPHWNDRALWVPWVYDAPFNGPGTIYGSRYDRFDWDTGPGRLRAAFGVEVSA